MVLPLWVSRNQYQGTSGQILIGMKSTGSSSSAKSSEAVIGLKFDSGRTPSLREPESNLWSSDFS